MADEPRGSKTEVPRESKLSIFSRSSKVSELDENEEEKEEEKEKEEDVEEDQTEFETAPTSVHDDCTNCDKEAAAVKQRGRLIVILSVIALLLAIFDGYMLGLRLGCGKGNDTFPSDTDTGYTGPWGNWGPWGPWNECSVTCGGGIIARDRICNMTLDGNLTAPCEGDNTTEEACRTYDCLPLARTCTLWKERGLNVSTSADLDPDGDGGDEPVKLYCDMTNDNGIGVTVIGHDVPNVVDVTGKVHKEGDPDMENYVHSIIYDVKQEVANSIVDQSAYCEQYIRWQCHGAVIKDDHAHYTGWITRSGQVATYFGRATPNTYNCECGETNTCHDRTKKCNCNSNDQRRLLEDNGYLTRKEDLPVKKIFAGDTGSSGEWGYYTLGQLRCKGKGQ